MLRYYTLTSCSNNTTYTSWSLNLSYTVGSVVIGDLAGAIGTKDCATISSVGEIIEKSIYETIDQSFIIDILATQPTSCGDVRCPQPPTSGNLPVNGGGGSAGGGSDPFSPEQAL
jgi:hypothetical protein